MAQIKGGYSHFKDLNSKWVSNFKWFVRKNLSQVYPKACGVVNSRFSQVDSQEYPRHNSICRWDIQNTGLLYNPRSVGRPIMHNTCMGNLETAYSKLWRQVTCRKPCIAVRTALSKIFGSQLQWGGQNAGDLKYVVYSDRIYGFIHLVYNLLLFRRGMPTLCLVTHCINDDDSIFSLISEIHSWRFFSSGGLSVLCHLILGSGILNWCFKIECLFDLSLGRSGEICIDRE